MKLYDSSFHSLGIHFRPVCQVSEIHKTIIALGINPFSELLKWTLPSLNLDMSTVSNRCFNVNIKNRMANSVDPDETAHDEPSHLDLHCLHRYLFCSARLKESNGGILINIFLFLHKNLHSSEVSRCIASRCIFFNQKVIDSFLISPRKHILPVLIRISSPESVSILLKVQIFTEAVGNILTRWHVCTLV